MQHFFFQKLRQGLVDNALTNDKETKEDYLLSGTPAFFFGVIFAVSISEFENISGDCVTWND